MLSHRQWPNGGLVAMALPDLAGRALPAALTLIEPWKPSYGSDDGGSRIRRLRGRGRLQPTVKLVVKSYVNVVSASLTGTGGLHG